MAVICCATPSELYLEETRSTLQFASRAKLVKTHATVNEVLDDRSIIRRLQRELEEAKRLTSATGQIDQLKELESKAASAGNAAKEAKKKLDRLRASILNAGYLFANPASSMHPQSLETSEKGSGFKSAEKLRGRRRSEGGLIFEKQTPTKEEIGNLTPNTMPRLAKKQRVQIPQKMRSLSPAAELRILREALSSKSNLIQSLKVAVEEHARLLAMKDSEISEKIFEKDCLLGQHSIAKDENAKLRIAFTALQDEFQTVISRHEETLAVKDAELEAALSRIEGDLSEQHDMRESIAKLQGDFTNEREQAALMQSRLQEENGFLLAKIEELTESEERTLAENATVRNELIDLRHRFDSLQEERIRSAFEVAQTNSEKEDQATM